MDVKINPSVFKKDIKVGDLININDGFFKDSLYIVMEELNGFILRAIKSGQGATGHFRTISLLTESIEKHGYTHYSQDEYQLVLEKKG